MSLGENGKAYMKFVADIVEAKKEGSAVGGGENSREIQEIAWKKAECLQAVIEECGSDNTIPGTLFWTYFSRLR